MYYLNNICCICFGNKNLQSLSASNDDITFYVKLTSTIPDMCVPEISKQRLICKECRDTIDTMYKFRQKCLRNKIIFTDYISKLRSVGRVEGYVSVRLMNLKHNIKPEEIYIKTECESEYFNSNFISDIKFENVNIKEQTVYEIDNKIDVPCNTPDIEDSVSDTPGMSTGYNAVDTSRINEEIDIKSEKVNFNIDKRTVDNTSEVFECYICETKLFKKNDVTLHMLTHEENCHKCSVCDSRFIKAYDLRKHMRTHTGEKPFKCNICNKSFTQLGNLSRHKLIHTGIKPFQCSLCVKTFTKSSSLTRHMKIHSGEKPQSSLCNNDHEATHTIIKEEIDIKMENENPESTDIEIGYISDISKSNPCNVSKEIIQNNDLPVHTLTHDGNSHKCSLCGSKCTKSSGLKKQNNVGLKPYECSVCNRKFTRSSHLTQHIRTHTGEKPYECSVCNKKFTQQPHLILHMRIHTGEKPYECTVCNKRYMQPTSLSAHMRNHTGERPHECSVCNKKFTQSSHLTEHMRIHTGEKPYECTVCNKKFTFSSNLSQHMVNHTGEKAFKCDVCNKRFIHSTSLTHHMRVHTGEKPYECSICGKTFARTSQRTEHMLIHTGENLFECNICEQKFPRSNSLARHKRTEHKYTETNA